MDQSAATIADYLLVGSVNAVIAMLANSGRRKGKATEMPNFEILAREDFSDVTYLLTVRHPLMALAARPGQFVIVMLHEEGERIPLTIADFDRKRGTKIGRAHV